MQIVLPSNLLRRLDGWNIKVDYDWFLAASHEYTFESLVSAAVDLLMRHVRRNIDEVAGPGFGSEFEMIAPTHSRLALDYVDNAFKLSVMMSSGLCVGVNGYNSCPKL